MFEMITAYVVGSVVGFYLFRNYNRESIITTTLDALIKNDYLRSFEDDEGVIQLYKWYEFEDLIEELRKNEEDNDTP